MKQMRIKPGVEQVAYISSGGPAKTVDVRERDRPHVDVSTPFDRARLDWTALSGKYFIRRERVFAYLAEARSRQGQYVPVCFQIVDPQDGELGVKKLAGAEEGTARIPKRVRVRAVTSFE